MSRMAFRLTDFWWILPNRWTQIMVIRGLRAITDFEYELADVSDES